MKNQPIPSIRLILSVAILVIISSVSNAQDQDSIDEIKAETERLKAEAAYLVELEKKEKAKQQLELAQDPNLIQEAKDKAIAEAQKATAEIQKAAAEARTAAAEAEQTASQAEDPTTVEANRNKALADARKAAAEAQKQASQAEEAAADAALAAAKASDPALVQAAKDKAVAEAEKAAAAAALEAAKANDPALIQAIKDKAVADAQKSTAETQTAATEAKVAAQKANDPEIQEAARLAAVSSSQKAAAEANKQAAEAAKAAAEAKKAEFKATLPDYTTKPLEGAITADDESGYFVQLLAYESLKDIANGISEEISSKIKSDGTRTIYITTSDNQLQLTAARISIENRLKTFSYAFQTFSDALSDKGNFKNESLLSLQALPAIVGVAADTAAFFRVDRSIYGKKVEPSSLAVRRAVAGQLISDIGKDKLRIVDPSLIVTPPENSHTLITLFEFVEKQYAHTLSIKTTIDDSIEAKEQSLSQLQTTLKKAQADFKKTPTEALKELISDTEREIEINKSEIRSSKSSVKHLNVVLTRYGSFSKSLTAPPNEGSEQSNSAILNLFLNDLLSSIDEQTFLLDVKALFAGGEMETRRSIWGPGKVRHRAGAVCYYTLYDKKGQIVSSGIQSADRITKDGKRRQTSSGSQSANRNPRNGKRGRK